MDRKLRAFNGVLLFVAILLVSNQDAIMGFVPADYRFLFAILLIGLREYLKEIGALPGAEDGGSSEPEEVA